MAHYLTQVQHDTGDRSFGRTTRKWILLCGVGFESRSGGVQRSSLHRKPPGKDAREHRPRPRGVRDPRWRSFAPFRGWEETPRIHTAYAVGYFLSPFGLTRLPIVSARWKTRNAPGIGGSSTFVWHSQTFSAYRLRTLGKAQTLSESEAHPLSCGTRKCTAPSVSAHWDRRRFFRSPRLIHYRVAHADVYRLPSPHARIAADSLEIHCSSAFGSQTGPPPA